MIDVAKRHGLLLSHDTIPIYHQRINEPYSERNWVLGIIWGIQAATTRPWKGVTYWFLYIFREYSAACSAYEWSWCLNFVIWRRSFLSGRRVVEGWPKLTKRRCSERCSLARLLVSVSSYINIAWAAGPRRPPCCKTMTVYSSIPRRILNSSPTLTNLEDFTRSPFRWTLPPFIDSAAKDRVLKKRAAHSHLSNRSGSKTLFEVDIN